MKPTLKLGDVVRFTNEVVKRLQYDAEVENRRGVILSLRDRIAEVDFQGTFNRDDGHPIRMVPLANLQRI